MAITLLGSNLNQLCDQGRYETDPSTWGFPGGDRTGEVSHQGLHSHVLETDTGSIAPSLPIPVIVTAFKAAVIAGKKYTIRAWVRSRAAAPPTPDDGFFNFFFGAPPVFTTFILETTKTVLETKDVWQQIEYRLQATASFNLFGPVTLNAGSSLNGFCFIDEVEIFEYEDVPPPACTLEIDVPGTVITDSTGVDGSIDIATSGGVGALEYSKDDGATWQPSHLFAGLSPGIYPCKVREVDTPGCVASYTFNVADAGGYAFSFTTDVTHETIVGANNGAIAITVLGDVAPFTFSKDAGATFQPGNLFNALPPGIYTVVVKDAGGIIRSANVTINAGEFVFDQAFWSKNPIPFSISAPEGWDELTNFRMFCEVRVEDNHGSSIFNSKMKMELFPDSSGECLFNLRQALRGVFRLTLPAKNDGVIRQLTDRIRLFKKFTGELQDLQTVPDELTESLPSLALYGGMGAFAHASFNYFIAYLTLNKKFLTWQPNEKEVDLIQEDYLNYFVFQLSTSTIKLQLKAYYDDGTSATSIVQTKGSVKYGQLYQIPAGPANCGVTEINPAKNLVKYELALLDQDNSLISEVRTFLITELTDPITRYVMIVNSLGTHEVHKFTGDSTTQHDIAKDTIQKYLPPVYSKTDGQFQSTEASFRSKISYSSGYLKGNFAAEWQAYFTDLFLTRYFYDLTKGDRYPMMVVTNNFPAAADHKYDHFVRFDAVSAYQDPAYTPPV